MKNNFFYVIYSKNQTCLVFTTDFRKFKKQFFKLVKTLELSPISKKNLKNYFLLMDFFSVNKILIGNFFVTRYETDEVYQNVVKVR